MTFVRRYPLWFIAGAGLAIRLFFAFHWYGNGDILTFDLVGLRFEEHPLHIYSTNIGGILWPYPPGYLLWLLGAVKLARHTGLPFDGVVQLLPILADLGIALAVYVYLGWRGASSARRVAGFALVALGPSFIAISGYHGQLDAVAILPGVLALMVWERRPPPRRAIESGVLIGIGAVIKTVPMLMILPLIVSARPIKERVQVVVAALAVVVITCLPFLLAEPSGFKKGPLDYSGVPGRGGLSLIANPSFAANRRTNHLLVFSDEPPGVAHWLSHAGGPITVMVLLVLGVFLLQYRPATIDAVVLLWLSIFVFSPNFLLQYLVWALPFFIMAGYMWEAALLQIAVIPVLVITYSSPSRAVAIAYVVMMVGLWIFWVVALATVVRRVIRRQTVHQDGTQPPLVDLQPLAARA